MAVAPGTAHSLFCRQSPMCIHPRVSTQGQGQGRGLLVNTAHPKVFVTKSKMHQYQPYGAGCIILLPAVILGFKSVTLNSHSF